MLWLVMVDLHRFFFVFFFKDSCNKQHDGIYVNGLTCYMVLFWCCFNYAMLSGTTLRYWICTGLLFFFVLFCFLCVTTFWGWMQAGVYINALSMARHLNHY